MINHYLILLALCLLTASACEGDNTPSSMSFDCIPVGTDVEIFIVIEEEPVFNELEEFINGGISGINFDPELSGELHLGVIILDTGSACLARVEGINLSAEALSEVQSLINTMPAWTPGRQGGVDRHTHICIEIDFVGGQIIEVRDFTGRC